MRRNFHSTIDGRRGYTLKAIAEMMGMSYINAKVIHSKALAFLREKMSV